jgi:hypothetical protein
MKRRDNLRDLDVNATNNIKMYPKDEDVRVWTGLIWHGIGVSGVKFIVQTYNFLPNRLQVIINFIEFQLPITAVFILFC